MVERELVKGLSIFSDMREEHLDKIASWGTVSELNGEEVIFREGEKASQFFGVVEGTVELTLVVREKVLKTDIRYEESIQKSVETAEKEIVVDTISVGETLGWSAFIHPKRFTTNAKSVGPSRILSLPADKLKELLRTDPGAGYVFMERLAQIVSMRLRNRTEKLIESWNQAFDVPRV